MIFLTSNVRGPRINLLPGEAPSISADGLGDVEGLIDGEGSGDSLGSDSEGEGSGDSLGSDSEGEGSGDSLGSTEEGSGVGLASDVGDGSSAAANRSGDVHALMSNVTPAIAETTTTPSRLRTQQVWASPVVSATRNPPLLGGIGSGVSRHRCQ